jgi:hypothetical protein
MMKIELDWCHLQAGTGDHLLENSCTQIDYIETCWIMSIRDFLRMYTCGWNSDTHPVPLCEGDEFSLWMHCAFAVCSARDMQRLNAVCTCEFLYCPKSQLLTVLAFAKVKGTDCDSPL